MHIKRLTNNFSLGIFFTGGFSKAVDVLFYEKTSKMPPKFFTGLAT